MPIRRKISVCFIFSFLAESFCNKCRQCTDQRLHFRDLQVQPVFRRENERSVVVDDWIDRARALLKLEVVNEKRNAKLRLHHSESQADAVARTLTERQKSVRGTLRLLFRRKAIRIECRRVGVDFRIVLNCVGWNEHHLTLFNDEVCALDAIISRADARQVGQRRIFAH